MHAAITHLRLKPGAWEEYLAATRTKGVPAFQAKLGFRHLTHVRTGEDRVTTISAWESRESYEAALAAVADLFQGSVGHLLAEPPQRVGGEVVSHVVG